RLLQQVDPGVARLDEAERAERDAERAWCAECAAALEFLPREHARLVLAIEPCQEGRGVGTPRAERRRADSPLRLESAALEEIPERILRSLQSCSQARARLQVADMAGCGRRVSDLRVGIARFGGFATREKNVGERDEAV